MAILLAQSQYLGLTGKRRNFNNEDTGRRGRILFSGAPTPTADYLRQQNNLLFPEGEWRKLTEGKIR